MKKWIATSSIIVMLVLVAIHASATDYYLSNSGNDANNGTSTASPWQNISKINSFFNSFQSGDRIFFNRGHTFYGTITPTKGFAVGNPLIISAYGTGANPIITGFTTVSAWTNLGSNIWESTSVISTLNDCNVVTINGVNTPMGRFPNTGWLTYQSASANTLTSNSLNSATTNWTGADIVWKFFAFGINRAEVSGHSGTTLTYTNASGTETGNPGYGCFIEDDARTLDVQNEWYYNPTTKKIRIYSTSSPVNVKVATAKDLVFMTGRPNITFDGLSFQGANEHAFYIGASSNTIIQNCSFDFNMYTIYGGTNFAPVGSNSGFNFNHNTVNHSNTNAIVLASEWVSPYVGYNSFKNVGMFPGMFKRIGNQFGSAFDVIKFTTVHNGVIEYNYIDSTGFCGVHIASTCNNTRVNNNEIIHYCMILMDGAGIYFWVGAGGTPSTASRIYNNICHDGIGENAGTLNGGNATQVQGIYLDENTCNVEVSNNTCFNNPYGGVFFNSNQDLNVFNNTLYNNEEVQFMVWSKFTILAKRIRHVNNISFSRTSGQLAAILVSEFNDIISNPFFSEMSSNYYARPIDDNQTLDITYNNNTFLHYNLAQWKTYFNPKDADAQKSPKVITDVNDIRFEYNATSSPVVRALPFNYMDVRGVTYNGTITLQPYTSAVLMKNGPITGGANKYYFSDVSGNDGNPGTLAAPFKTLTKFNSVFITSQPGDSFFLKRGETFYGFMSIGRSGTAALPMNVTAYGTGARPIVTGFTTISGWTSVGGGIYESPTTTALLPFLNMVTINNVQYGMGRFPNTNQPNGGYSTFESFAGTWNGASTTTITDAQLSTTPFNWTGAEVVIKPYPWLINRAIITAHSGGTLSFLGDQQPKEAGYGYFIQNDVRTLDQFGEWYHYKPPTERIRIYTGGAAPTNVQAATIDSLVYSNAKDYISISNITFKGANSHAIYLVGSSTNFFIDNCDVLFAGVDGITLNGNYTGLRITNCNVQDANNNGILATGSTNGTIQDNTVRNTYTIPGMGGELDGQGFGIRAGVGTMTQYNRVINSGYVGIYIGGNNSTIQYNFIDSFCVHKDDGGGIYTANGNGNTYSNRLVKQNIVLHAIGAIQGTTATTASSHGIYMDNQTNNVNITDNSVAMGNAFGGMVHDSRDIIIRRNTFYNNTKAQLIIRDDPAIVAATGLNIKSNIFATKYATEQTLYIHDDGDAINTMGAIDSNIYAGIIGNDVSIINQRNSEAIYEYHNLQSWKLRYPPYDANGAVSLKNIVPYRDLVIVGGNKIPSPINNSTFDVAGEGWTGPTAFSATGGILDAGHLDVTPSATVKTDATMNVGAVSAGVPYIVRFSVKATTYSNQGSFGVRISGGTYFAPFQYYKILTTRDEVEMMFVSPLNLPSTALHFQFSEGGTIFHLDNIQFFQATATVTNPADSIRFEYNDTKVNKVVSFPSNTYKDVRNVSYVNSITLAPFTSAVLIRETPPGPPIIKTDPIITWNNPAAITYGTALSGTQLNATANTPGTFVYTPASGTILNAGTYSLVVDFTPTDQTNWNNASKTVTIVVNKATATLTYGSLTTVYNAAPQPVPISTSPAGLTVISTLYNGVAAIPVNAGTYSVSSSLSNANYQATTINGTYVINKAPATLVLSNLNQIYNGSPRPITVVTSPAGLSGVNITYNGSATAPTNAGSYAIVASLTNTNYIATNVNGTLVVAKATPIVSWATPAAITYGTALSGAQLNATANVAGSFTYTPVSGSILNAGTQLLSVNFTPTDATNYNVVNNTTVNIVVNKATATLTLGSLAQVYNGSPRSATVTTNPVGLSGVSITYDGSPTPPTNAGSYTVVASLVNTNYTATNVTGTLVISKATATLTLSNLTQVYDGTTQPVTVTTAPAGLTVVSVTYNGSATVPTNAGSYSVIASLSNANYQATNASGTLVISKATPTINWSNPAAITYGTALSGTQLNATATYGGAVPGTFVYTPPSGTILNAGTNILTVNFTPTDAANFNSVNGTTVNIVVNKATATINLSGLAQNYDGNPKPVTVTTTPAGLAVIAITYNGSPTAPTAVGSYPVVVTLTNSNYTATNATGTLVISKGIAALTITNTTQTYDGTTQPVTVTTTPPGLSTVTVTYNGSVTPPTNAGTYAVVASLSNANYQAPNENATLTILKATPVVNWATPSAITYGTALSGAQLNATSATPGTFTYLPASGSILNAGTQILSVNFTPTDNANYNSVNGTTVGLVVNKAVATITLSNLTQDADGSPRPVTVTTSPAGLGIITTTYDGSTTAPSAAGSYAVVSSLTNANYTATNATGTLVINTSAAAVTITNINQIYDGSPKPVTVTVTGGWPYDLTYNGSVTVPTNAGSYTVVATINDGIHSGTDTETLVIAKANPVVTWANPTAITYGTALSATQLNATANTGGVFTYTPASGAILNAGTQILSVSFAPTDAANYNSAVKTVTLTVDQAVATITLSALTHTYDGTPKVAIATTSPAGLTVVTITYDGSSTAPSAVGTYAVVASLSNTNYTATNATGNLVISTSTAAVTITNLNQTYTGSELNVTVTVQGGWPYDLLYSDVPAPPGPTNAGTYSAVATINDGIHIGSATETFIINKANPIISWSNPSAITYGTALSGIQLNATASVAGIFTYTPPSGTILNGGTQVLSTAFAPTDNANYNSVPATAATIIVNQAAATITLSNLSQTYDGTPKSATATTSPVGLTVVNITYNGSPTVPTAVGSYTVNATLVNSNYTATPATGTLVISSTSGGITISNENQVYTGSPLPVTVTTNPAGISHTVTYNGSVTVPTVVGNYTVVATLTGGVYTGSDTKTLVIAKATPTLNWNNPASIPYGVALTSTQLNATASVPGSYAYMPPAGTVLNAGTQNLSVTFTPTDGTNYNVVNRIVTITVTGNTATLTINSLSLNQTYDGTPQPVSVTTSPAGLSGVSITYNGSVTAPTNAGSYTIVVSLSNANYTASNVTGTLVIAKADPMLSWLIPLRIFVGTPLSATQLNATANIAGTFVYTPPAGTVLPIGTQQISATFTPTDGANYNSGVIVVPMSVYSDVLNYYITNGRTIYINF